MKNPKWRKQAEEQFFLVLETVPYDMDGDVPTAVELGRVAAARVNISTQQSFHCQEISVCF